MAEARVPTPRKWNQRNQRKSLVGRAGLLRECIKLQGVCLKGDGEFESRKVLTLWVRW
jgi:hypothetical protein